jgi:uncharacterized membrane protein
MKKNMGGIDKLVRIIVALIFVLLYFKGIVTGVWGIVMLVIAAVFVLTSLISFCPLYTFLGLNTTKKENKE